MRKSYRFLAVGLMACLFSVIAYAQPVIITGTVRNNLTKEKIPGATIMVKGTSQGTFTNADGVFSLKVTKLPVVLVISSTGGYENLEVTVTDAMQPINVNLIVREAIGQEVVVAASRLPQRILEAPVTVERLSNNAIKNVAAPSVYEALTNLKGVDVHTASLTFRTVTTRGFVSSGNLRLNQLVDGMDNQAPGLNFAVSNVVGLTDLDLDNIEILSGASSALYGSGGMNGTVLITSKSPFKYQGLSYNVKQGIMHVDKRQRPTPSPYNNIAMRWAKVFKDRLAIRISGELIRASDWEAEDYQNKQQIGVLSKVVGGNRQNDPAYNGVNVYGDETSVNLHALASLLVTNINQAVLAQTGGLVNLQASATSYFAALGNPMYPSNAQVANFISLFPAPLQPAVQLYLPLYLGVTRNYFGLQTNVSRTGYEEDKLVDYNTLNAKLNTGIHYKINNNTEVSVNSYMGTGTTVYTGANRYSLRGFKMAQHKFEVKSKNWFYRAYTIQENAGDSYIGDAVGAFMNEAYRPSLNTSSLATISTSWYPIYMLNFSEGRRQSSGQLSDYQLHNAARAAADVGRFLPGTPQFKNAEARIRNTPVNRPGGARFLDKSDLYAMEAQLNLSSVAGFSNVVEVLVGGNWKQWVLNSKGTIFADTLNAIRINEYGGYMQLQKKMFNDVLTLTASGRYDKQQNFKGRFTPRVTAVVKTWKDHYLRLSYQSAYRFPSNQNQYISLRLGGGNSYLIGCLPEFQTYYGLNSANRPGYTAASVLNYRAGTPADSNRLVRATFRPVTPEKVFSYEVGYKALVKNKLLVDAYFYMSRYESFLISEAVVQSTSNRNLEIYSPFTSNNFSYVQNSTNDVKTRGWGISVDYNFIQRFWLYGNVFSDVIYNLQPGQVSFFNAPKYRYNIGLRNDDFYKGLGLNVVFKWQDNNYYEGTFVTGTLPYFGWLDAQISYRPRGTKSVFRIGGTNVGNFYARTGYGSPAVGGLYYMSYGYNIF